MRSTHGDGGASPRVNRGWLRLPGEVTECVACASSDLRALDLIPLPRRGGRRQAALLDGCGACGLLFVSPMPARHELDTFYAPTGGWADDHAARAAQLQAAHARRLRKGAKVRPIPPKRAALLTALAPFAPIFAPPPGARVLDFGCGDGKLLNTLQEAGWQTFGIEPSSDIAFLRHQRLEQAPRDGRFDLVLLHHVLEHVGHPLEILQQLAGTLRAGGVLSVIVPRFDTLPAHGDYRYCINGRNHLLAFTETCLSGLLARAGFEVAGRLHNQALDDVFTAGQPMRLRLVARLAGSGVRPAEPKPLAPALRALAGYRAKHATPGERLAALLPPRLRAAWVLRAR